MENDTLTMLEWMFVSEYVKDWNATATMRRLKEMGYYEGNYYDKDGSKFANKPRVAAEIARCRKAVTEAIELNVQTIVDDLKNMVTADPRELVETVYDACRCCWGEGNQYMYTPNEWRNAQRRHEQTDAYLHRGELLDPLGGIGFDPRKGPNPDCGECHGRGEMTILIKDTRHLSPAAVTMYNGAKQTKNGIEVMLRSKDAARADAAKWLGMNKSELTVLDGKKAKDMTDDELAVVAARGQAAP